MHKIYIVVEVTYDYFRFQKNLYATTDLTQAREFTASVAVNGRMVTESEEVSQQMDDPEIQHYFIQTFTNETPATTHPQD